jgi:hypothetical protein
MMGSEVSSGLVDLELRMRIKYNCCYIWLCRKKESQVITKHDCCGGSSR